MGVKEAEEPLHQHVILLLQDVEEALLQTLVRQHGQDVLDPGVEVPVHPRHRPLDDHHVRAAAGHGLAGGGARVALSAGGVNPAHQIFKYIGNKYLKESFVGEKCTLRPLDNVYINHGLINECEVLLRK